VPLPDYGGGRRRFFTPARPSKTKIKKDRGPRPTLQLKPTPDILRWAGRHKSASQVVVGFALEDRNLRDNAERKLRDKHLDMIVANTPAAINAEMSTVHISLCDSQWMQIPAKSKTAIARRIVSLVAAQQKHRKVK